MSSDLQTELQSFCHPHDYDESALFSGVKHHFHKRNASQKFQWFATDSLARLNKKSQYGIHDISYEFNSDGYRCDELTQSDIVFLGCSYTFGSGLPLQDVWAHKVATHFKVPYINLAFPAGSVTYNLRTLMKTWEVVKPKIVIGLFPYNHRLEFVSDEENNPLKVWVKSGIRSPQFKGNEREKLLNYELYTSRAQEDHLLLSNIFAMNQFIKTHNARFVWSLWEYEEEKSPYFLKNLNQSNGSLGHFIDTNIFSKHKRWENLELRARDSSHPGPVYHEDFASLIINELDRQFTTNGIIL